MHWRKSLRCFFNYCNPYQHSGCLLMRTERWMQCAVYLSLRPSSHEIWSCPSNMATLLIQPSFFGPLVTVSTGFHCILSVVWPFSLLSGPLVGNQHTAGNHDFLYIIQLFKIKTAADSKAEWKKRLIFLVGSLLTNSSPTSIQGHLPQLWECPLNRGSTVYQALFDPFSQTPTN